MSHNLYTSPRLTSGDKDVVSLVNGFGYGGGPTPGASKEFDFKVLDTHFSALVFKFDITVNGSFIAGVAGPGWGTGTFDNELLIGTSADDRSVSLGGGAPVTEAGFLVGAQVKFGIRIKIAVISGLHFTKGHFETTFSALTDVNTQETIDLIRLVISAIEKLVRSGQGGALKEILKKLKPAEGVPRVGWGLLEKTTEPIKAISTGSTTDLLPVLTVRIDLSQFVAPIRVFNQTLSKVGSSVQFGPAFGIGFPIHIQVEGVVVDVFGVAGSLSTNTKEYYESDQGKVIEGVPASDLATPGYRPKKVGLRYTWSWGLDITIGVFAKIQILKIINIAPSFNFGLLEILGIDTNLQSGIRGDLTNATFAFQSAVAQDFPQPVEVVFEAPERAFS